MESKLLAWGVVEGAFSEDEIADLCETFFDEHELASQYTDEDEFLESLEEAGLLFPVNDGMHVRYRTRMSETVRLLANLRQLFPKHLHGENSSWQAAKPLVGDFRFMLRPRSVPQRQLSVADVRERLEQSASLSSLQHQVLTTLLTLPSGASMSLAGFQARATQNIMRELRSRRSSGSIVCAGTGSGKTLAFYLPTFLSIAESIERTNWTRCLAIYPRNELLKDQLSEAYAQARRLDAVLQAAGKRKLTIATLFGQTPPSEQSFNYDQPHSGWIRTPGEDHICPFLTCPAEDCDGQMVWNKEDCQNKVHRLRCEICGTCTEPDELILTRDRLCETPADILFTTTEMLNQRMGDSQMAHVFGIGSRHDQKPSMVLLDEVHTYYGVTGAQVAMLLRRWKHMAQVRPHFVGLSATLSDARRFFATLIGEPNYRVAEIAPASTELIPVGREYLVALRGDPASRTALLSTTIQTAMLMRRTLDASNSNMALVSDVYGSKVFVFTDDLDVTNRMFFNLRDAEGQDSWGQADRARHPHGSLANLRHPQLGDERMRNRFGQSWELSQWLGHSLQDGASPVHVDRTSSQDAGVASNADIIVATASLDVGFNDPEVNVVLQHKAPRDPAQFLQRKGRAGRRIEMRPWTIVTLSDYGRDRLAWESFDLLFDPQLPPRDLPVRNRYVLRMQAVFAFFDWIATQLRFQPGTANGSVFGDFTQPASVKYSGKYLSERKLKDMESRQQAAAEIIEALLFEDQGFHDLVDYLTKALGQSEETIESLLWDPPRALMNTAIPTLLRRLQTDWRRVDDPQAKDNIVRNNPLPEFVPGQLFGDLNLPEVTLITPAQRRNEAERRDVMPIIRALSDFAPGRVSKRFGVSHQYARHWIRPGDPSLAGRQTLELRHIASQHDELGTFERFSADGQVEPIRCVRPREVVLSEPEPEIRDSSNARLTWQTQINPQLAGTPVDLPDPSRWESVVTGIEFFTHNLNNPVEIRRFASQSQATINFKSGQTVETTIDFIEDLEIDPTKAVPESVGLGFALDVDGLVVRHHVPDDLAESLRQHPEMCRCLRVAKFRDDLSADPSLDGIANHFQRGWLAQVFQSALATAAINRGVSLQQCWEAARTGETTWDIDDVLAVIFQSIPVSSQTDSDDQEADQFDDVQQQLQEDLRGLFAEALVMDALLRHAPNLWETPDDGWTPWLTRKYQSTLGAAILDGIQQVCSDLNAEDLLLDIEPGPRPASAVPKPDGSEEIWITERTIGGWGIIEAFLIRYGKDPRRFFDLVENALRPSDYEIVDQQLSLFLNWVTSPNEQEITQCISTYRDAAAQGRQVQAEAFDDLRRTLKRRGLFTCHGVIAALGNRVLRPGSNEETDALVHRMVTRWRGLEDELQIEIDPRVLAYLESADGAIDDIIRDTSNAMIEANRRQWRFNALFSLLWPRGGLSRSAGLSAYNRFASLPETDHDLVRINLTEEPQRVSVADPEWFDEARKHLVRDSEVILATAADEPGRMRTALMDIITEPIDAEIMLLHPKVRRVDRQSESIDVTLSLAEGMQ